MTSGSPWWNLSLFRIADVHGIQLVLQLGDGRVISADGAVRVFPYCHLAETHFQSVVGQQSAGKELSMAEEKLDRLGGLKGADHPRQDPDHPGPGAGKDGVFWWRGGEDAAVARRFARLDSDGLAVELENAAVGIGFAGQHAGVVDQELGGEVVGGVDDEVISADDLRDIAGIDPSL